MKDGESSKNYDSEKCDLIFTGRLTGTKGATPGSVVYYRAQ